MANDFGLTFAPGAPSGAAKRRNPVQEAIQILSLRLPKVFGARAPAPTPLLTGPGGMGQPAARGNVVAQALAQMAGLPPSMARPPQMAPSLGIGIGGSGGGGDGGGDGILGGGGTDTTEGWRQQERTLQGPGGTIREPEMATPGGMAFTPGAPHVSFLDTGEGPSAPGPPPGGTWSDPRPTPPSMSYDDVGFGSGSYGSSERQEEPTTWLSPFERQHGRYPDEGPSKQDLERLMDEFWSRQNGGGGDW